ncbi:MAG TPA: diacylglycerol kinase family protein [Gemmatimonadaceae bacterium]|nr:diacylglycerol kinase family protein [Gemmatimonadaceae bacterium]
MSRPTVRRSRDSGADAGIIIEGSSTNERTPARPTGVLKAFLNAACGNAEAAREAIAAAGFDLQAVQPKELEKRLKEAIGEGTKRILVAGGDGTIATAAALVAKTGTELAILPGGTLNHFAKDHGIPTDLGKAALIASDGPIVGADIGYVNDCVFLNTSSLGAYVTFVRERERLEKHLGYSIASVIAFVWMLSEIRTFSVTLEVEGKKKTYRASLVFIGVGERELKAPILGSRVKNGRRGLHVMIVQGRRPARLFALALAGITKGRHEADKLPEFDEFLVDSCRIDLTRPMATVGLDGELKRFRTPLDYHIERDALRLVVAPPGGDE